MRSATLVALVGFCCSLAHTSPVRAPQPAFKSQPFRVRQTPTNTSEPCAQVSTFMYDMKPGDIQYEVPAGMALDCMMSVPLNMTSAKALLRAIIPYIHWQSTLSVLRDPPREYQEKVQPPIDILAGIDSIDAALDSGSITSEYEFGWSLYTLIASAHDGHLQYVPDSIGSIFSWGRPVPLVSVSEDGSKLPAVFVFGDVLGMQFKNISYAPSPVVKIDDEDAHKWLEDWAQYGSLQDRDALYNSLFYSLSSVAQGFQGLAVGGFTGGGRHRFVFPGDVTKLTFANGSSLTMKNFARPMVSFRNVHSGSDIQKYWFYFGTPDDSFAESAGEKDNTPPTAVMVAAATSSPGYPEAAVVGPGINGFYINEDGYEDVAVLSVTTFVGDYNDEVPFQATTQQFLPKAAADGKTKLIIDVSGNGGGTIMQGYDMFKQLFPSLHPYGATRFRAHDWFDTIGQSYSAFSDNFPRSPNQNSTIKAYQSSYFDYHSDTNENNEPFTSWKDKLGPVEIKGDKYSKIARWNLSDPYIPVIGGISVSGYGALANASKAQYFQAENILILTDGYCASTCTIFSELMRQHAGVKIMALGGRSNKNPMQAIGGVKGTNNYGWAYIQNLADYAIYAASSSVKAAVKDILSVYQSEIVFNRAAYPPGVNVRDGLRQGDTSGTALQFIYEEADCRLFYTPGMTVDATEIWKAAADAHWGGSGKCVMSGYSKRDNLATRGLEPRRPSNRLKASELRKFEQSFDLRTECHMTGDGFMHP
ncbi:peptidase S41 family protein-like protein [Delitschia confertaspora ATCC 74209]|uniref:Peptidase S41 family protein-like protein n=1 Tax=Delitschia confertaspora ATCC 74209 TaxID=1513339 RepID=A0A9P4JW76_9PLEO|nr:peptidase S41 family protein-like protein [Delitschia confertaspora ATCC 74209]